MNKLKAASIFLLLPFFIFACGSTKEVKKPPRLAFEEPILSKGIDYKGNKGIPINPTTTFSAEDPKVIASLNLENLSGKHTIRWDWHDPNGNLYHSTGNYPIESSKGKYIKDATAWHRVSIRGEKAADYPGDWKVNIYLDKEFIASKMFKIISEINVDELSVIAKKPNPNDWALIIGIENYASLPSVDYAKKDALMVKEYFIKIFGVPEENIIFLFDGDATKARLEGFLKNYIPKNVGEDTILYVYFAGHGAPHIEKGDAYLIAYDSDTRFIAQTGYQLKNFYEDLNRLPIKRSFVFLDSCFSGVAARGEKMLLAGARPALIHVEDIRLLSGKVVSLAATTGGQISNSYPEREHGLFTYFLLRGLRGEADTNDDSCINVDELYNYVKNNVTKVSRRKGMEQTPIVAPFFDTVKKIEISKVLR